MAKYEVVHPWFGVRRGDVVELETVHPALKPNIRPLIGGSAELVPAIQETTSEKPRRGRPPKDEASGE